MTEPTDSTPSGPKKLNFAASSAPKPKFLTPALQAKLAEEQAQAIEAAAEEQNGLLSEEAAVIEDPAIISQPDVVEEPVIEAVQDIIEPAPVEPAPVEPVGVVLDAKVADALAKIKEAQEELLRAQQQILSQVAQQPPAPEPTPTIVPQTTAVPPRMVVAKTPVTPPIQQQPAVVTPAVSPVAPTHTPLAAPPPLQQTAAIPSEIPPAPVKAHHPIGTGQPAAPQKTGAKKNKTILIISGVCALLIGILGWYNYTQSVEQDRINRRIETLGKLGGELKRKANDLGKDGVPQNKYDPKTYGIEVSPNREDANMLIDAIKETQRESGGWESNMQTLCVMATLDPQIADMLIGDIRKNSRLYGKNKLVMIGTLLSAAQDQTIMSKLKQLADDLGKDKQFSKQATLMTEMKTGMLTSDLPDVMEYLRNKDTNSEIKKAANNVVFYLLTKASPTQRETTARELLTILKTTDEKDKTRFDLLERLAQTGTPQALSYFMGMMTGGDANQMQVAARSLTEWPNDSLYDELFKLWSDDSAAANLKKTAFNLMINQLANDRQRTDEQAMNMFQPLVDAAEKEATPEAKQKAKIQIVTALKLHKMHGYVKQLLDMYEKDADAKVSARARDIRQFINNREAERNKPKMSREDQQKLIREAMQGDIAPA